MFYTTVEGLQGTIQSLGRSCRYPTLKILVSPEIHELLPFHVPSCFKELWVLRCARRHSQGILLVDGASTYAKVRLDMWQEHRHRHHLTIGHERGVRIKLANVTEFSAWGRSRNNFSDAEKAELRMYASSLSEGSSWKDAKSTLAPIMGIVVGTRKCYASVNGMFVKYAYGFHHLEVGILSAKVGDVATAAGTGLALSVATAVAVYYIPWPALFNWLDKALTCIWDVVSSLWQSFKDWVMKLFSAYTMNQGPGATDGQPRPMGFS